MTNDEYQGHVKAFLSEMRQITEAKNADYSAGSDDAMNNYYELAEAAHGTPLQAWITLLFKHITAIKRFIKDGKVSSETIHGRFIDLANYAMLGDALIKDMTAKGLSMGMTRMTEANMQENDGPCVLCGGKKMIRARKHATPIFMWIDCPICLRGLNALDPGDA